MAPAAPDLIVIGGGVTGVATAYAAARRGLRTVLVERFHIGHRHGSSHGESRIIRLAYRAGDYITLVREAYQCWEALQRRCGAGLLRRTGGLDVSEPGVPSLDQTVAAMRSSGVGFSVLSRRELRGRFPQLAFESEAYGVYQPDAAVLDADQCVRALAASAVAHGARITEQATVRRLRTASGGVVVDIDGMSLHAGAAVVTAGSWTNHVLRDVCGPLPLTVTREQVGYFEAGDRDAFAPDRFPLTIEHRAGRPPMISIFPVSSPESGVKVMLDRNGPPIEPDDLGSTVDGSALESLTRYVRRRLPGLGALLAAQTCRYTMTPDEDFIVDLAPGSPQVAVASACSGHGFKFAPVLGEVLVDLVTTGGTGRPVAMFGIGRPALAGQAASRS